MTKKQQQKKKPSKQNKDTEQEASKDIRAADYLGYRSKGQPIFLPHELGYVCPICNKTNKTNLKFSEYNDFLWCKNCNIDIPSCLCVRNAKYEHSNIELSKRERIEQAIEVFFATADDIIDNYKNRRNEEQIRNDKSIEFDVKPKKPKKRKKQSKNKKIE